MFVPQISILVPVYNVEAYLRACLDSILSQTFTDFEVILVDDGSTDNSGDICDEYAKKDNRVQVIHKSKNEGTLLARKTAALIASGNYTVFIDSDDLLSSAESLQMMYDAITLEQVDILQFSIEFLLPDGEKILPESGFHRVYTERLEKPHEIVSACIDGQYGWNLWNKIYRTSVCQRAYKSIKDVYVITAEDCYVYFLIAYHAETFKGKNTVPLYTYRQGSGVTKRMDVGLDRFELFCRENLIVGWIRDFLSTQEMADEECSAYEEILKKLSKRFLDHCLWRYDQVSQEERKAAQGEIFGYFPSSDVFEIFHEKLTRSNAAQAKQKKEILGFRQDIAKCRQVEQGLRADIEKRQQVERGLRADIKKRQQVERELRADIEKRQQVERELRQEIVSDKKRFKIIKDFNVGRYLRTKMLSKISLGKTRQRLREQYQHQKYCYRLIKKGNG